MIIIIIIMLTTLNPCFQYLGEKLLQRPLYTLSIRTATLIISIIFAGVPLKAVSRTFMMMKSWVSLEQRVLHQDNKHIFVNAFS